MTPPIPLKSGSSFDQPCHADVWLEVLASPLEMQVIDQLPEVA